MRQLFVNVTVTYILLTSNAFAMCPPACGKQQQYGPMPSAMPSFPQYSVPQQQNTPQQQYAPMPTYQPQLSQFQQYPQMPAYQGQQPVPQQYPPQPSAYGSQQHVCQTYSGSCLVSSYGNCTCGFSDGSVENGSAN
jgi:hypothetical protein